MALSVFFDLDGTLWDYRANAKETLTHMVEQFDLPVDPVVLGETFLEVNDALWGGYQRGQLTQKRFRELRFIKVLSALGIQDYGLAHRLSEHYIVHCPKNGRLKEGVVQMLKELKKAGIPMYIATNGFHDVQKVKLSTSGLTPFFRRLYSPQVLKCRKPDPAYFQGMLRDAGVEAENAVMVGDEASMDVFPAQALGIRSYYVGHKKIPNLDSIKIRDLASLIKG